ncbi:MAG TPA: hypothetical protein DF715_03725 [Oceanicaulis sp.]|nr:hypothetical protein [Oceanicaulis sp.]
MHRRACPRACMFRRARLRARHFPLLQFKSLLPAPGSRKKGMTLRHLVFAALFPLTALTPSALAASDLGETSDTAQAVRAQRDTDPQRRLVIGGECASCDFSGSNLAGAHLYRGDFANADFSGAQLLGARFANMRLDGADFSDASMREVRLSNVTMSGAILTGANMTDMRAHQVMLQGANAHDVQMNGASLVQVALQGSNLREADFSTATIRSGDMRAADLSEARLTNVVMQHIIMHRANLRDASMEGAFLDHVDLTGARLAGANLAGARFRAVNLTGVDLSDVDGLTPELLAQACGDASTRLPDFLIITLSACDEPVAGTGPVDERAFIAEAEARRLAQLEAAQEAFANALASVQSRAMAAGGLEREAMEHAREALREAARAQAELARARAHTGWQFEIRRSEVGEPVQFWLEDAQRPSTPPAPPSPPARSERPDRR